MDTIRAGYGQFDVRFGDWEANAAAIARIVGSVEADLLIFPELAMRGYEFTSQEEAVELAEPFGSGRTSEFARDLAATHGTALVIGYSERADAGAYNACLLALPDGRLHNYRKIQLFNREKIWFLPGDRPGEVIATPLGRIGMMICSDWLFPEVARSLAIRGAQIIAHPANLILPWCQRAMFARCLENRVYGITANRIGSENRAGRTLTYTGGSQVMSPMGETLVSAPADAEHAGVVEIQPALADDKTLMHRNDLIADRRPEMYAGLWKEKA
jgi:predicted amidohydrolase